MRLPTANGIDPLLPIAIREADVRRPSLNGHFRPLTVCFGDVVWTERALLGRLDHARPPGIIGTASGGAEETCCKLRRLGDDRCLEVARGKPKGKPPETFARAIEILRSLQSW
jgi:hypothetical protein